MNAKALACGSIGHRWRPAEEIYEGQLVMQCKRCGRTRSFAAETRDPAAWGAGRARGRPVGRY